MVGASILPLRLEGAEVRRGGRILAGPVDLTVSASGCTVIIGPNGAGKTTLLRSMHGLERLTAGSLRWAVPEEDARERQAFVFQTPVMMRRTVSANLTFALRLQGVTHGRARREADAWLERIGLADAAGRSAPSLSGGERQKLALARALIRKPEVLFLDEPCSSLDGRATREIETLLRNASAEGTRIVMSTHNMGQARRLASEVLFIHRGKIIESAPAAAFFTAPRTPEARAFLKGDIIE